MKLTKDFYNRDVVDVAKDLLGKQLVCGHLCGIISETEAYGGQDDKASHAWRGKTKRNQAMYGPPGHSYVYMIYGMYHCLNVVTQAEGCASAVLIRGLTMPDINLNGPGKLCRHLDITRQHNNIDLTDNPNLYLIDQPSITTITATPRIGISKATDKLWRFIINS